MDVELYIYDLSNGLARQYSTALTGVHIDAIYHTAVVLNNTEYFFGQGIHRKIPGSTHHGRPMKVLHMGRTDLPMSLIEEYIQSLKSIYTPESYDLFVHNCNNFSQDLCMFLTGRSIPEEIASLPETFLKTPIGQMLRGQIDQSMRRMTQAPDAVSGQDARPVQTNGVVPRRPAFVNSVPQAHGSLSKSKHPHSTLKLPLLEKRVPAPILATSTPPLDKLLSRISSMYGEIIQPMKDLASHVKLFEIKGPSDAPLPDMQTISLWIASNFDPSGSAAFAIVDLFRTANLDPRISAYLATETGLPTLQRLFTNASSEPTPYNLAFTRLQLLLNLFSSTVAQDTMMSHANSNSSSNSNENNLRHLLGDQLSTSLLEPNSKLRLQAALLTTNLAALDHNARLDGREDIVGLNTMADGAVESALVQAVIDETDAGTSEKLLLALGLMLYLAPEEAGIGELCEVMGVADSLRSKEISELSVAKEVLLLLKTV